MDWVRLSSLYVRKHSPEKYQHKGSWDRPLHSLLRSRFFAWRDVPKKKTVAKETNHYKADTQRDKTLFLFLNVNKP